MLKKLLINSKPVEEQAFDSCYQEILDAVYRWHEQTPGVKIPGYYETQYALWKLPDDEYKTKAKSYDEIAFNWATAMAGTKNSQEAKLVDDYYKKGITSHWTQVKKFYVMGKEKLNKLSDDHHLSLIRYFNPLFSTPPFSVSSPAALELALRKYGPLFAVGKLVRDTDGTFLPHEHTIMVTGVVLDPARMDYGVWFQDGISPELKCMSFNSFMKHVDKNDSAILFLNENRMDFCARGERQKGMILRFELSPEVVLDPQPYYFDRAVLKNSRFRQIEINPQEDVSWLKSERGCLYIALPEGLSVNDLEDLSLVLCSDPHDALRFLEADCSYARSPVLTHEPNDDVRAMEVDQDETVLSTPEEGSSSSENRKRPREEGDDDSLSSGEDEKHRDKRYKPGT